MLSDYDPIIVFNEKISIVNDNIQYETNQIRIVLNEWSNQTPKDSEIRKKNCEICLARHVSFEGHHIAGQKHDHRQITVCIPCHNILTRRQKLWDARWLDENNSEFLKTGLFYRGCYDVLNLIAEKRQNSLYSDIANLLIETIFLLQKEARN
jgi:hypothetical protein